jgi:hypothetical protein
MNPPIDECEWWQVGCGNILTSLCAGKLRILIFKQLAATLDRFQFIGVPARMQICADGIPAHRNLDEFAPAFALIVCQLPVVQPYRTAKFSAVRSFLSGNQPLADAMPFAHDASQKIQRSSAPPGFGG